MSKLAFNATTDLELFNTLRACLDAHRPPPRTPDQVLGHALTIMQLAAALLVELRGHPDMAGHGDLTHEPFMQKLAHVAHQLECAECSEST
jgi:hypothetical protein